LLICFRLFGIVRMAEKEEQAFLTFLHRSIARVQMKLPERAVGKDFVLGRCKVRWARMSEEERLGFGEDEYDQQNNRSQDINGEMQEVVYRELTAEELYGHSMVWDMQDDALEDDEHPTKVIKKKKVVNIKEEKVNERQPGLEGSKKRKTFKRDPNLPKRAPSSYLLFCAEERPRVRAELGGDWDLASIGKELGRRLGFR
jgi:hypothetical protein